jgi:CRISPR-associated protein Csx10
MNGFLYTLTLEEPVLANSLGGEPNSANSLFYIPGGLVRGAAISSYTSEKDSANDTFRNLFLNGKTRYLNAYPLMKSQRTLPIPIKFKKPKYSEAGNFGQVKTDAIEALEEIWQINVHTQRDAERGRSTADSGAIYRYIALPVGMQFQGAVIGDGAENVRKFLDKTIILLGKARTAGYGRVRATVSDLPNNWAEGGQVSLPEKSTQFTLTLLSPALVRDANGQHSVDIKTALGAHVGEIEKIESVYKTEIVGGFNRTWGLPLPQVIAIAAGSVFTITTKNLVTAEKLRGLEANGLGERRAEGFGSLAVNLSMPELVADEKWSAISPETLPMFESESELPKDVTELMLSRLLRRDMDGLILTASRDATFDLKESASKEDVVPNSQLSRWRVILRDALSRKDESVEKDGKQEKYDLVGRMLKFYEAENKKRSAAWIKMEKARVNQISLTKWIEEMLKTPAALSDNLGTESLPERRLGNLFQTVDDAEYRLLLIDAVLARIVKINKGRKVKHA